MKPRQKKVLCAVSGGIDSSVAVVLLRRQGFRVVACFLRLHDKSSEAEKRAKEIAHHLSIPLCIIDLRKEFKEKVIDYFIKEHRKGRTPNPCVVCNEKIKISFLLKKAKQFKCDFIATGHYARKKEVRNKKNGKVIYKLFKAKDKKKDQSYFLWRLNQGQLAHILFPIGDYTKNEVKKLAKEFRLPVFDIPESQEICFISDSLDDFLTRHIKNKAGKIVDIKGNELGKHQGLFSYTIGQRKGIKLPGGPYYVVSKDIKKNILVVSKKKKDLLKKQLLIGDINWISGKKMSLPLKAKVKIRYRHKGVLAIIKSYRKDYLEVIFSRPQEAITPGQSAVFYKGQEVLGGGVIY